MCSRFYFCLFIIISVNIIDAWKRLEANTQRVYSRMSFSSSICYNHAEVNNIISGQKRCSRAIHIYYPRKMQLFQSADSFSKDPEKEKRLIEVGGNKLSALKERLASAGQAGLVAYGFLNCLYYLTLTAIAWKWTSKGATVNTIASALTFKEKYAASITRLGKVSLTVWAGSQATKALRIFAAISMAPFIDKLIDFAKDKWKLKSRSTAVSLIIISLLTISVLFYASIIFGNILFLGK